MLKLLLHKVIFPEIPTFGDKKTGGLQVFVIWRGGGGGVWSLLSGLLSQNL